MTQSQDTNEADSFYTVEELLPIVAHLTRKYTSNESSSVSYETASQLMDAVLYCIQEYFQSDNSSMENTTLFTQSKPNCNKVYEWGYQKVIQKSMRCKDIYDQIIEHF